MSTPFPGQRIIPTLRINNYNISRAYYSELLGCRIDSERCYDPDTAVLMQVSLDGMVLYLSQHEGDGEAGGLIHLFVRDVDALYAELRQRGTPVKDAPHLAIDGCRTMTLLDPDGNILRIATQAGGAA